MCENEDFYKIMFDEEVIKMDTFRKEYTPLDDEQKKQVQEIKVEAEKLYLLYSAAGQFRPELGRELALAKTKLEESVMWAVKAVTTAKV